METGRDITLPEMLAAREKRALRQRELIQEYHKPLISFTMNIAGPVKTGELIRRAFLYGESSIRKMLAAKKYNVLHYERITANTGDESLFVVEAPAILIKELTVFLEDGKSEKGFYGNEFVIGRLFDMDVICENGEKVDRQEVGAMERTCLICDAPAKVCARSRMHSVEELRERTQKILKSFFAYYDADMISRNACKALIYEATTTPKPGLVDRTNNGSHEDMDIFSFIDSVSVLKKYFYTCANVGIFTAYKCKMPIQAEARLNTDCSTDKEYKIETIAEEINEITQEADRAEALDVYEKVLQQLRQQGLMAEGDMLAATGGVNTHKGAIFSMGLLCAALGTVGTEKWDFPEAVLAKCACFAKGITDGDFKNLTEDTAVTTGEKLFLEHGIRGARGQAEDGYPAVLNYGLPVLERELKAGQSKDMAGAICMLYLLGAETDTNLIARSDKNTQEEATKKVRALLAQNPSPSKEEIEELDREFISKNLSPGGSADLLALCWMLHFMREEKKGFIYRQESKRN